MESVLNLNGPIYAGIERVNKQRMEGGGWRERTIQEEVDEESVNVGRACGTTEAEG